jgi:hypothetical protein
MIDRVPKLALTSRMSGRGFGAGALGNLFREISNFDAQAADLGIAVGHAYPMDIFHAERHTSASNFGVETNIACFSPPIVR